MSEHTAEKDVPACYVCGKPATTSDGICVADLCDNVACLDAAWDRAFPSPTPPDPTADQEADA